MARKTAANLRGGSDLEPGSSTAVAAAAAAYHSTAVRAYADVTTGLFVVTQMVTAVDGTLKPLNVVTDGTTLFYTQARPDDEPYANVIARVEEALLPQYERPQTGSLAATGIASTLSLV